MNTLMKTRKSGKGPLDYKFMGLSTLLCSAFVLYQSTAHADNTLHKGFNALGTTQVSIVGIGGSNNYKPSWDGLAFAIGKSSGSSQCKSGNQALPHATIDGYSGMQLAPGVLFVIYEGSLSGSRGTSAGVINYSYRWDAKGVLTPSTDTEAIWCADPRVMRGGRGADLAYPNGGTWGELKTGIYVSSNATNTTIPVPQLYVTRGYGGTSAQTGSVPIAGTGKSYSFVSVCTVSTPNEISFGTVDVGSEAPVIASNGDVGISCQGPSKTVNLLYSVSPRVATPTPTTLAMTDEEGNTMGTVRGFIGTNAQSQAGCTDVASSMRFNNTHVSLLNNTSNNSSNTIPLKWVLCPWAIAAPGKGKSSAILNIFWN